MSLYVFTFLSYYGDMVFRLTFFCIKMKVSIRIVIACNNNNDNDNRHKLLSFIF